MCVCVCVCILHPLRYLGAHLLIQKSHMLDYIHLTLMIKVLPIILSLRSFQVRYDSSNSGVVQ